MTLESKTCQQSRSVQAHRILPFHCNMHQTLYGGQLMEFIDNCASITVSRHTRSLCVTASMDQLNFLQPLNLSDSVCVETMVSGTGSTSVEVFAKVVGERLETGERYLAATAFLTFVTVPQDGQKVYAPGIIPETEEEKFICSGYEQRQQERLAKRIETKRFNERITIQNI
ncbi:acyl-CoA thioesterase [Aerococcaceae bacterium NML130460]|nr:acyl-CoA thioesterase [Aerococcaceae bacterium NML130460]